MGGGVRHGGGVRPAAALGVGPHPRHPRPRGLRHHRPLGREVLLPVDMLVLQVLRLLVPPLWPHHRLGAGARPAMQHLIVTTVHLISNFISFFAPGIDDMRPIFGRVDWQLLPPLDDEDARVADVPVPELSLADLEASLEAGGVLVTVSKPRAANQSVTAHVIIINTNFSHLLDFALQIQQPS